MKNAANNEAHRFCPTLLVITRTPARATSLTPPTTFAPTFTALAATVTPASATETTAQAPQDPASTSIRKQDAGRMAQGSVIGRTIFTLDGIGSA